MKKRKKFLTKISLFFAMALLCIISFVVPTKAYYVDNNGNLVSDNKFGVADTTYQNYGVTIAINNGVISVSGTANSSQWIMFPLLEPLTSNTYTFSFSNNSIYTNFGFSRVASMGGSGTEWFQFNSNPYTRNITEINYFGVAVFNGTTYSDYSTTIMCNIGSSALAYEPYGTYYSQTNYDSYGSAQYSLGYDDALAITNNSVSILDKSNLYSCGLYYHIMRNQQATKYHLNFIYNGVYGYEEAQNWNEFDVNNWNVANEQWQTDMENNIYTPYGFFYKTNWSIYQFIQEYSDATAIAEDELSYLEYNFITPIDLDNLYFGNVGFSYFEFYDNDGNLLFRQSEAMGYFPVTVSGCKIIRAYSNYSDYADEPVYFYTSSKSGYNSGYFDGYVSRQTEIENLKNQINEINATNLSLRNQISYLENQLNNLNGSWQSVFFSLVDIPFLTVSKCLGFELFGLNLYRALIGILTIMAIFFLFRKIMGK